AVVLSIAACGCGGKTVVVDTDGVGSEIATSVVSGAVNNSAGSTVAMSEPPGGRKRGLLERLIDELNPVRPAWAAKWACTGGTLAPTFSGPAADPYKYTPLSCMVTWKNGKTASASWSGAFTLTYGTSCDNTHAFIGNQATGCALTRTTGSMPNSRTLTGPEGGMYSITHDTNGAGSGWDSTVSPAPSNGGIISICAAGGCAAGRNVVVSGSHLTGTLALPGGAAAPLWDHTVSTGAGGITVTGEGATRVVSGTITVQHNIAKFTSTSTFNNVGFGDTACCYPTSGTVTTTFDDGPDAKKTESLSFSAAACGEAMLTRKDGSIVPLTLKHCI
ncbi:MAG TPA: hypothetical protein VGY54_20215, partial [Polyangiaceae bacterium]|nr:hypothetical protein [Polyangiaceae bacterium]